MRLQFDFHWILSHNWIPCLHFWLSADNWSLTDWTFGPHDLYMSKIRRGETRWSLKTGPLVFYHVDRVSSDFVSWLCSWLWIEQTLSSFWLVLDNNCTRDLSFLNVCISLIKEFLTSWPPAVDGLEALWHKVRTWSWERNKFFSSSIRKLDNQ